MLASKGKNSNQLKIGAILSYLLIVFNSVQGLVLSPYILAQIGSSSYGVYKTVASFSSVLMVLDLGIGTTMLRYTAKFRAEKKTAEVENFAAMGLIEAAIISLVVAACSVFAYYYIPSFYQSSFAVSEIRLAQRLFIVLAINLVLTIIENVLNGVITGLNQFVFANSLKLGVLVLRVVANVAVLQCWKNAMALVLIGLCCSIGTMVFQICYIRKTLKLKIRLRHWDKALFRESFYYTSLMFLQTIAIQANGNVDNVVISYVIGASAVAVYSFGIQMFHLYQNLAMAISNMMLPTVSSHISAGKTDAEMQGLVTRVGRMQFVVLGAALAGFFVVGKDFVYLWLGEGFHDVYYLALIMMIPETFTLIQNVCLSILRARNMMRFRVLSLFFAALLNIVLTVVGTRLYGYYAAAIATAISIVAASIVAMNLYYRKRIGFRVVRFYRDVFRKLLLCVIVPAVAVAFLRNLCEPSWLSLGFQIVIFLAIYAVLLLRYGLDESEKTFLFGKLINRKQENC